MAWKYLSVLNAMLQILSTVGLGGLLGRFGILDAKSFVPASVRFVFYVALPCLVIRGLGIGINLYNDAFLWDYIAAWILLRLVTLIVSILVTQNSTGNHVAIVWLSLSWISTVILGVPISAAVFGNPDKGRFYGLLAGISSFVFQLPLQLFLLECHGLGEDTDTSDNNASSPGVEDSVSSNDRRESHEIYVDADLESENVIARPPPVEEARPTGSNQASVWRNVLFRVFQNPVLWAIALGFLLSLTRLGSRYLNPSNDEYFITALDFLPSTLNWLGSCVSPVSLIAMGAWMQSQGISTLLGSLPIHWMSLYMLSKLVLVPLLMIGLAKLMRLGNEAGRASVLIASLPISLASFSLGHQYNLGEAALASNVAVGTLLMLPTVLVWNLVMDEIGLYVVQVPED